MKKFIAIILAAVVSAGLFSACGNEETAGTDETSSEAGAETVDEAGRDEITVTERECFSLRVIS